MLAPWSRCSREQRPHLEPQAWLHLDSRDGRVPAAHGGLRQVPPRGQLPQTRGAGSSFLQPPCSPTRGLGFGHSPKPAPLTEQAGCSAPPWGWAAVRTGRQVSPQPLAASPHCCQEANVHAKPEQEADSRHPVRWFSSCEQLRGLLWHLNTLLARPAPGRRAAAAGCTARAMYQEASTALPRARGLLSRAPQAGKSSPTGLAAQSLCSPTLSVLPARTDGHR